MRNARAVPDWGTVDPLLMMKPAVSVSQSRDQGMYTFARGSGVEAERSVRVVVPYACGSSEKDSDKGSRDREGDCEAEMERRCSCFRRETRAVTNTTHRFSHCSK